MKQDVRASLIKPVFGGGSWSWVDTGKCKGRLEMEERAEDRIWGMEAKGPALEQGV